MWMILALMSGFGAAVLAIMIKLYLKHINPLFVTFVFSIFGLVFLILIELFSKKVNLSLVNSLSTKEWVALSIAGILNTVNFICYMNALKNGKTGGVIAIDRAGIIFVLILSVIVLQEKLTLTSIVGSVIMIAGVVLINL